MIHILGGVLIGALIGKVSTSRKVRPLLKEAVKGGLRVTDRVRELGRGIRAEAEDLVAEARAEMHPAPPLPPEPAVEPSAEPQEKKPRRRASAK